MSGTAEEKVRRLQAWWAETRVLLERQSAELSTVISAEQSILGGEYRHQTSHTRLNRNDLSVLYELTYALTDRLRDLACQTFAPAQSVPLEIDADGLWQQVFDTEDVTRNTFDPDAVDFERAWQWAASNYGGERGHMLAFQAAAQGLITAFRLDRQQTVETKAGRMVLRINVWMDDFWKKHYGRSKLDYRCKDRLNDALTHLASFALWAQDLGLKHDLDRYASRMYSEDDITSRERISFGDDEELGLITYQTNFEFRFAPSLAEKLQVFIATFGTLQQDAAA
jgi:hypothetical protein